MHDFVEHSAEVRLPGLGGSKANHYKDVFYQKTVILLLVGNDICFKVSTNRDPSSIESAASYLKDITLFINDLGIDVFAAGIFQNKQRRMRSSN